MANTLSSLKHFVYQILPLSPVVLRNGNNLDARLLLVAFERLKPRALSSPASDRHNQLHPRRSHFHSVRLEAESEKTHYSKARVNLELKRSIKRQID